jgi:hypothetical protein
VNIRINENCNEFGRTFTVGQVVSDLPPMERLAMVLSGFASWIGADGNSRGANTAITGLPDVTLHTPITSRQFANPPLYNVAGTYSRRASLEVGERRYVHNGQTYRLVGDGVLALV